ncbi:MAG: ABC transporter permease [Gammaproteobacteria bacterium]|nr:ABC transporter permease [Gammaproteobacteria bacterium]MDH5653305.1 ABC transporter permease [Gammaproteobacteria bacterium]
MMILTLAQRELRSLFYSPLAWAILAVSQFILAYLFLAQLQEYLRLQPQLRMMEQAPGITDVVIVPIYSSASFIMMMVVPLLTMRLISEERRSRSLTLLFSAPISMTEIIVGKFLGIVTFLAIMIGMVTMMPLSLSTSSQLDYGLLFAVVIGILLMISAFAAVGLYMSTLTVQPTVAAMSSFGITLLLWIIDWAGSKVADENASGALAYMSMLRHFEPMTNGVFNTADIMYYLLFITTFLVLSIRRLDADRLQH